MDESSELEQGVLVKCVENKDNEITRQDSTAYLTSSTQDMQIQGSSPTLTSNTRRPLTLIMCEYIKILKKEICDLEDELDEKDEKIIEVRTQLTKETIDKDEALKKKNEELQLYQKRIEEKDRHHKTVVKQVDDHAQTIRNLQEEVKRVQYEKEELMREIKKQAEGIDIEDITSKEDSNEQADRNPKETKQMDVRTTGGPCKTSVSQRNGDEIQNLIETVRRIDERCSAIDLNLQNIITEHDGGMPKYSVSQSIPLSQGSAREISKSYADAVGKEGNLRNTDIKMSQHNASTEEMEDHDRRAKNIIVFGLEEATHEGDCERINELIKSIDAKVLPNRLYRIGEISSRKHTRPVKLIMETVSDKDIIMSRLKMLKYADAGMQKLSIRDDYTYAERDLVKKWTDTARRRNEAENTDEWKIRGSPRTGLRMIRRSSTIIQTQSSTMADIDIR